MKFFRRVLQAYRLALLEDQYDYTSGEWTDEDSQRLYALLEGTTGLRLKARLINFRARCAIEATRNPGNAQFHCGIANGVAMTLEELNSFASPMRNTDTSEEDALTVHPTFGIT